MFISSSFFIPLYETEKQNLESYYANTYTSKKTVRFSAVQRYIEPLLLETRRLHSSMRGVRAPPETGHRSASHHGILVAKPASSRCSVCASRRILAKSIWMRQLYSIKR